MKQEIEKEPAIKKYTHQFPKRDKYLSVKIRYNTTSDGVHLCWRVIIDGVENFADNVEIIGNCATTMDEVKHEYKHHISCLAKEVTWSQRKCFIKTA